jgi:ESCRT-II complex subunit VPS36
MEFFQSSDLTNAGRPILVEEEVEIKLSSEVDVWTGTKGSGKEADLFVDALFVMTNYRFIIIITNKGAKTSFTGREIWLREIVNVKDCASFLKRSKRIQLLFYTPKNLNIDIGLRFNQGNKEDFIELFQRTLEKKSWIAYDKKLAEKNAPKPVEQFSVTNAGVGGLIRRQEKTMQSVDNITKDALSDMDMLVKKAREVVDIVQRYAAYRQEESNERALEESAVLSETSSQIAEINEMENIMQSIGIISPVTKYSAGRMYHMQLAQQIADLLSAQQRLQRLGGMITLTDLYCVVNRARGTELVSPEDLLAAAKVMHKLSLGMQLREFPSGVKVIELENLNEAAFAGKVKEMFEKSLEALRNGVSASDVASYCNISLTVAKERLLLIEKQGILCRDEHISGVTFFLNKFEEFLLVAELNSLALK